VNPKASTCIGFCLFAGGKSVDESLKYCLFSSYARSRREQIWSQVIEHTKRSERRGGASVRWGVDMFCCATRADKLRLHRTGTQRWSNDIISWLCITSTVGPIDLVVPSTCILSHEFDASWMPDFDLFPDMVIPYLEEELPKYRKQDALQPICKDASL
jgi:hypothetical protein